MSKIKLMIITHDLAIGGLQQVVVNLCKSIDRSRFDISVLCLRGLGEFADNLKQLGIKVFLLEQKATGTDYFSFLKVAKLLRQEKVQVIHTHNTQPFLDGTIAALLSRVNKVIHTDHARVFPDKWRYMIAERIASLFAYKVVAVSEQTAQNLIRYEKISPKKIAVISNGIDSKTFDIIIDKKVKREQLGIENGGPIIGICARLCEVKGITYILKSIVEIVKVFPNVVLAIAGNGPLETNLKIEVVELGVQKNVIFLGPRSDIPELLKLFDCYVMASLSEGLPMILLEAMAAKCPIVSTNVGGIPDLLKHNQSALLVPPKDPQLLATALINLLSNSFKKEAIAENAYRVFFKNYTADSMAKQYEALY